MLFPNGTKQTVQKPSVQTMIASPNAYPKCKAYRASCSGRKHLSRRRTIIDIVDATAQRLGKEGIDVAKAFDNCQETDRLNKCGTRLKKGEMPDIS